MKTRLLVLLAAGAALSGCGVFNSRTAAEQVSGYTYIPLDPFEVLERPGVNCADHKRADGSLDTSKYQDLLKSLPDNAVRMLVETFDSKGNVTYGASKVAASNETYRVTIDYISADTKNIPLLIKKQAFPYPYTESSKLETIPLTLDMVQNKYAVGTERFDVRRHQPGSTVPDGFTEVNLPVYIGLGLRLTANVETVGSKANISGIGVIGAEAEANRLRGSLTVQTLGVNGKSITSALPIQSELNRTTAQNAVVAVASIKTLLHADDTRTVPRVVGLYLPFPGGKPLVNAILSEISRESVEWKRPCVLK